MKTNLVIATYAANYGVMNKKNYLKYNLSLLNKIKTDITQITVMKAKINEEHQEYPDYYNFDNIDISNIKDKIKIIECENIGISYGQFFKAIQQNMDFDYHIFIEDDILIFMDFFEEYMKNEINKINDDAFLCMFYFKTRNWNLIECLKMENEDIRMQFIKKMDSRVLTKDFDSKYFTVPDNTFGIISKKSVEKILNIAHFDVINDMFNVKFKNIWIHQVLFGYILLLGGVNVYDISDKNVNLFYHTGGNVTMCNYGSDLQKWKEHPYNNEKLEIPVFIPTEFLHPHDQTDTITHLKKYFVDYEKFMEQYNKLNFEMKILIDTLQ